MSQYKFFYTFFHEEINVHQILLSKPQGGTISSMNKQIAKDLISEKFNCVLLGYLILLIKMCKECNENQIGGVHTLVVLIGGVWSYVS